MHDVTVVYINVQEGQFIMLKSKDASCEIPLRSKPSNLKISFTCHKDNSNVQELSANPTNSLPVGRSQDGRNNSTDINVRIFFIPRNVYFYKMGVVHLKFVSVLS